MKQHRPRVSEDSYRRVMANLKSKIGDNESFDSALSFLLDEHEGLEEGEKINNDTIKALLKELSNTTDLLITETKRANKSLWVALVSAFVSAFSIIYIGVCL